MPSSTPGLSQSLLHQVIGSFSRSTQMDSDRRMVLSQSLLHQVIGSFTKKTPPTSTTNQRSRNPFFIRSLVPSTTSYSYTNTYAVVSQSLLHQVIGSFTIEFRGPKGTLSMSQSLLHQVIGSFLCPCCAIAYKKCESQSLLHQVIGSFQSLGQDERRNDHGRNPFFIRSLVPSPCIW